MKNDAEQRQASKIFIEEGQKIWKRHDEHLKQEKIREKKELREMMVKYSPWGRPGGGAPNERGVRMTNIHLEELVPNIKGTIQSYEIKLPTCRGTGGGGAPMLSASGKLVTKLKEDPMLRFQFNEPMRQVVDNDMRYRGRAKEKYKYKKQLDALVSEKKSQRDKENRRKLEYEKKLGWSNEHSFKKFEQNEKPKEVATIVKITEQGPVTMAGGTELVPLLAKRRALEKITLGTTDVTKMVDIENSWRVDSIQYLQDLSHQISTKTKQQQITKKIEADNCRKHFDTWGSYWGRPGHGAPRGRSNRLMNLHSLLYAAAQ